MMKRLIYLLLITLSVAFVGCDDSDSFSASPSNILTFSTDTVSMDTVFSTVPTSTKSLWVYNNSGDGIRLNKVRLQRGNQSGFRVNVDGVYLDNTLGSQASDFEVRKDDSIRVFVELTSAMNGQDMPMLLEDNLVFSLESGVEQSINLRAWSWDAILCDSVIIDNDSVITSVKPIVIRKGLRIDSTATLSIQSPAQLYFANKAGVDVYGTLEIMGTPGQDVVLRGDRTDRMFDYLPYDRVSGQWRGIRIHSSSTNNYIYYADIHSAEDGIVCDSSVYDDNTIRLIIDHATIHNCKGAGVKSYYSNISIANSQITNTLGDCIAVYGGKAQIVYTTIAQFYPFDANRGAALRFTNYNGDYDYPLHALTCYNTLVTGYADDVIMGVMKDTTVAFAYYFQNCILRTPQPETNSSETSSQSGVNSSKTSSQSGESSTENVFFVNTIFELPEIEGKTHFKTIDADNQYYDFHLDSLSAARGKAVALPYFVDDRDGQLRPDSADIGCYQYY